MYFPESIECPECGFHTHELVKAMSDPRYERDPAYRAAIQEKLQRSDVNF